MRQVDSATDLAVQAGKPTVNLLHVAFAQGSVYLTDAAFNIQNPIDGQTYIAGGDLLAITDITTKTGLGNYNKSITFSGASSVIKALVLAQTQVNREVIQYKAVLDDNYRLVGSPYLEWQGVVTKIKSKGDKKTPKVTLTTATVFEDFDRRVNRTTTMASQQRHFPNDTGMRYASETSKEIKWGVK